jgi:hypothetical protein
MTLSELISQLELLEHQVGDVEILIAVDEEGNAFDKLLEVEVSPYRDYGAFVSVLHPEDASEQDALAVVLWP